MRLNKNLVNLLKDLERRVDEADKKVIVQTLRDVSNPPLIISRIISQSTVN
jgi:hypothetical protein